MNSCWAEVLWTAPQRSLLVSTAALEDLANCEPVARFGALVEPVYSTDRVGPDVLDWEEDFEIVLAPGATIDTLRSIIPIGVDIVEFDGASRLAVARVVGLLDPRPLFEESIVSRIIPYGEGGPADERQAMILARQWADPDTGEPASPTFNNPGYTHTYNLWLSARGLIGVANQQTIAVFDGGVDIGEPTTLFHPDIRGRVLGSYNITVSPPFEGFTPADPPDPFALPDDRAAHATHVIGTAIGAGVNEGRNSANSHFARGQGIAPQAKALSVKRWRAVAEPPGNGDPDCSTGAGSGGTATALAAGHNWAVSFSTNPASIANHSWNQSGTSYGSLANEFEGWVYDASTAGGLNPMAIVFSAGNWRPECVACWPDCPGLSCHSSQLSSAIRTPADAKNVITVGSVDSWHPVSSLCPNYFGTDDPVDGPFAVSEFSARGSTFGVSPANGVHLTRVKPDVVAPGWRVDGPLRVGQPCPVYLCGNTSTSSAPFSYARGTSFAAPAVSGAVALKSKRFRDGTTNAYPTVFQTATVPTPTLLKASLIATAQSLGPPDPTTGLVDCEDCRPSNLYGWGLVDLNRLTETATAIYVHNEGHADIDAVGESWTSAWLQPGRYDDEILIAVVWNDLKQAGSGGAALQRDLDVGIEIKDSSGFLIGNNFEENLVGEDTGYSQGFGFADFSVRDHVNNVEAVFMVPNSLLLNQQFRIHVTSFAHAAGIPAAQRFSVYAWNARCSLAKGHFASRSRGTALVVGAVEPFSRGTAAVGVGAAPVVPPSGGCR